MSTNQMRKKCHHNIPKFVHKILDDNHTSIQPSFSRDREQAEEFYSRVYSASPSRVNAYAVPIITAPFTEEELSGVISGLKSSCAPSPVYQIAYTVIKKCYSLLPALMHL